MRYVRRTYSLSFQKGATLPLWGVSQREVRETAQRLSRPVAHREGGFCEPLTHVRGGCTPGNSRRSASAVNSRLGQLASLVFIEGIAHVRGPVPGLSIRAYGSSLSLVLIERIAHVRGGGWGVKFPASCLQPPFWGSLEEASAPPSKKNKSAKQGSPRAPLFCGLLWGGSLELAFSNFFLQSP